MRPNSIQYISSSGSRNGRLHSGSDFIADSEEREEKSGIIYYGSFYYSIGTWQFVSPHSLLTQPVNQSLYCYADGKPVSRIYLKEMDGEESNLISGTVKIDEFEVGMRFVTNASKQQ